MAKKEQLHLLIKSLTRAEKRYFRLQYAGGQERKYLLLFDAIDRQGVYDESAIRRKFRSEKFVRQLHVSKNYLTRLIMKSLRRFHSNASPDTELRNLLCDVEILLKRELLDQCQQALDKAEALALKYEKLPALLDICEYRRRLLLARGGEQQDELNAVLTSEAAALAKLRHLHEYWRLTINFFSELLGQESDAADPPPHPLLRDPASADTLQARTLYHYVNQNHAFFSGDLAAAEHHATAAIAHLEASPHRIREQPVSLITALNNRIAICLHTKNYPAIPPLLEKIRAIPEKYGLKPSSPVAVRALLQTFNVELEMYRDTGDCARGIALIGDIEAVLRQRDHLIPDAYRLLFYYQFAYLYYLDHQPEASLRWLNEIAGRRFDTVRNDIQVYAQLLNMLIHYELGNITVLRYAVASCRRFLRKKRPLQPFERELLNLFARLSITPQAKHRDLFTRVHHKLFAQEKPPELVQALDYLDFEAWLAEKARLH